MLVNADRGRSQHPNSLRDKVRVMGITFSGGKLRIAAIHQIKITATFPWQHVMQYLEGGSDSERLVRLVRGEQRWWVVLTYIETSPPA